MDVRGLIARQLCLVAMVGSAAWSGVLLWLNPDLGADRQAVLLACYAGIAILAEGVRRLPTRWLNDGMLAVTLMVFAAIALTADRLGWQAMNPALSLAAVQTCIVTSVARVPRGLVVAALAVGLIAWSAWQAVPQAAPGSLGPAVAMQLLSVVVGLAGGALISRMIGHYVQAARGREQRFAGLLGIAADAYWETDREHRVVHVSRQTRPGRFVDLPLPAPTSVWDVQGMSFDALSRQTLQKALDERAPLREVATRWQPPGETESRTLYLSGEPRQDADGTFVGYWGVAWDVTPQVQVRAALEAMETRYRELFQRLPTAVLLHRGGQVIDANPAALALFGLGPQETLHGRELVSLHDPADRERLAAQMDWLESRPAGDRLEPEDLQLHTADSRVLHLSMLVMRVRADGGDASLSIYVDDTERTRAAERLRHSEALLSHLVSTSPDLIAVTDMATGRLVMVNAMFARMTGHTVDDAVGQTAAGLGLWLRASDGDRLARELAAFGSARDLVCPIRHRLGSTSLMRVSGAVFQLDGREFGVINGRDITLAEQARVEREAILDNASIGIALARHQRFVQVNRFLEQMLGWPADALVGQPVQAIWPDEDPLPDGDTTFRDMLALGDAADMERTARRRDGSTFDARVQVKAIDPSDPVNAGTIWIVEDVTQRRRDALTLARARDEAEAASRAKSVFLANTSHEIRTPLNALLGLARLARLPGIDEARRQQYIEQISDSAETLSAILTDILDLSKIEAGRLSLDEVPFDLTDLLQRVSDAYGTLADTKGLHFVAEFDDDLPDMVMGDPVRVRQVLSNFLSNALKFTTQGEICLAARRLHGSRIRFEVRDTGQGVNAALKPRLFQPFIQGDDSTTRRVGGTGLGLSICRELARMMGGEVGIDDPPSGGSTFWAVLRLPPADDSVRDTASSLQDMSLLAGARVLMAEDNAVNMMIAVAMLQQWGVEVEQAGDGLQAIDAVERAAASGRPFDAVLMDVQMPVMSGHAAALALRRQFDAASLPIIALTAAALVSERQQALAAGMTDFLTKPIDAARLRATLARALGARRAG